MPRPVRSLRRAVALLAVGSASLQAQVTFGESLIARMITDSFSNFILVSSTAFTAPTFGQSLTSFSVFGGTTTGTGASNVGRTITPLLVSAPSGGSFTVLGVGTTRTIGAGINTWDFGLVSGSATVGAGTFFAWLGSGAVHYTAAIGPSVSFSGNLSVPSVPSAGASFAVNGSDTRAYSIQWTAGSAAVPPPPGVVPEPSTYVLLGTGLVGVLAMRGRRRRV